MDTEFSNQADERRKFRRVFSLVPEEDVVLFSANNRTHFAAKLLDLSHGGVLIYTKDPASAEVGCAYKLYFESRGQMFHLEGTLIRRDGQYFAFQFVNVTPQDLAEVRSKLARMEIMAARMCVG